MKRARATMTINLTSCHLATVLFRSLLLLFLAAWLPVSQASFCEPNPCLNGAECIPGASGEELCSCPIGFIGLLCEDQLNDTSSLANQVDESLLNTDPVDQGILAEFYKELEKQGTLRWVTTLSLCGQAGVTCDLGGKVTELTMRGLELQGTLPISFVNLTSLAILEFDTNGFHGLLPTEWGEAVSLKVLTLSMNKLEGLIPGEWTNMTGLEVLRLSSNFFPCEHSNYSDLAPVHDFPTWEVQCGQFCPDDTTHGTIWGNSQDFETIGTCVAGFEGEPVRRCLRSGVYREWAVEIEGPCKAVVSLKMIRTYWVYMLVPTISFVLTILIQLVAICLPSFMLLRKLFSITHALFTIGSVVANCWFLAAIYPYSPTMAVIGGCISGFWFLSNLGYSLLVAYVRWTQLGDPSTSEAFTIFSVSLISIPDLTLHHLLTSDRRVIELIDSLRLGNGYLLHIPFILLQLASLRIFSPVVTLLGIFFNVLSLVLLSSEVLHWLLTIKQAAITLRHKRHSSLKMPLLNPTSLDQEAPENASLPMRLLTWLALPLVALSFIPQALSLLGILFVSESIKRFRKSARQALDDISADYSWFGRRGYFLLSLNILSLMLVIVLLLPVLTLVAFVLLVLQGCTRNPGPFADFQAAAHRLLSCLLFSYIPFIAQPPPISYNNAGFVVELPLWKRITAIAYAISLEVALPLLNILTDIKFSLLLLHIQGDPYLEGREVLFVWTIVSFVATGAGILAQIAALVYGVFYILSDPAKHRLLEFLANLTPFGQPPQLPFVHRSLRVAGVFFGDLVQVVVAANTLSYVGSISLLWHLKLGVSLFTLCYHLSIALTTRVFGRDLTNTIRTGVSLEFFLLLGLASTLSLGLTVENQFCGQSRTIDTEVELAAMGRCSSITALLRVTQFGSSVTENFQATGLSGPVAVFENEVDLTLTFDRAESLSSEFSVWGNPGAISLSFPVLQVFSRGANLSVAASSLEGFRAPVLFTCEPGSTILFEDLALGSPLRFPALSILGGDLTMRRTATTGLHLDLLSAVQSAASLTISGCSGLEFLDLPSLTVVVGKISVIGNADLKEGRLPMLKDASGHIEFRENSQLALLDLSRMTEGGLNLEVASNPALVTLDLTRLTRLAGEVVVHDNAALENVHLEGFREMDLPGSLIRISGNSALVTLDFSSLDCQRNFTLILQDNPNLETVYIQEPCVSQVTQSNNPKLEFVHV